MYKLTAITAIGPLEVYGKFISRFVDNVKEQLLFNETEHIIVYSEWSRDFELLEGLSNFKLIKEDRRAGVYNAWNIGVQNATTKYLTNWNIDDLRYPTNTKLKYELLEQQPDISIAYNYYTTTTNELETFHNVTSDDKSVIIFPDNYEEYCMTACLIGPDPMWRAEIHSQIGLFDYENFKSIGDWEMWIRMAQAGYKFKLVPEILCLYLDHPSTVSSVNHYNNSAIEQTHRLYEKYKNFKTEQYQITRIML